MSTNRAARWTVALGCAACLATFSLAPRFYQTPIAEPALARGVVAAPPVALEAQAPETPVPPPHVSADAAVLMDAASGRVLFALNPHQRRAPASTTKIMTAVLALELGNPQDLVTVSRHAGWTPGSSAGIQPGERYPLDQLLHGLLLPSGNDAAVAIAEHLAGSVADFAVLMNAKAHELGMNDTHFTNPHGLTQASHYSSAYDLALLTRYALRFPRFSEVVATPEAAMEGLSPSEQEIVRHLRNTNRLLLSYPWADGVKTGTTAAAGSCLVASATRDGNRLIAVVLHSNDRWSDSLRILEWGFANFTEQSFARLGQRVTTLPVEGGMDRYVDLVAGDDVAVDVSQLELPKLRKVIDVPPSVEAPVRAGQQLGSLSIVARDRVLVRAPLVAERDVPSWSFWRWLQRVFGQG